MIIVAGFTAAKTRSKVNLLPKGDGWTKCTNIALEISMASRVVIPWPHVAISLTAPALRRLPTGRPESRSTTWTSTSTRTTSTGMSCYPENFPNRYSKPIWCLKRTREDLVSNRVLAGFVTWFMSQNNIVFSLDDSFQKIKKKWSVPGDCQLNLFQM